MKKISLSCLLVTACLFTKTFAQSDSAMKAWQDYMTPGDMHKMIAKYDGDWSEDVSFWMKPGTAPTKTNSTCHSEMIMDGRYQQSKISGDVMGMPYQGFSLLGYDNLKKLFTNVFVDNFGTGTMTLTGTWDDNSKTIIFKGSEVDPMSGKDMDVKETIQFVDDDTEKFQMFMESDKGEFKTMEIISTRVK